MDTIQQIHVENAAQDYVLKAIVNVLNQISPTAGPALKQMVANSTATMGLPEGTDAATVTLWRTAVNNHAQGIIDAAMSATPNNAA